MEEARKKMEDNSRDSRKPRKRRRRKRRMRRNNSNKNKIRSWKEVIPKVTTTARKALRRMTDCTRMGGFDITTKRVETFITFEKTRRAKRSGTNRLNLLFPWKRRERTKLHFVSKRKKGESRSNRNGKKNWR